MKLLPAAIITLAAGLSAPAAEETSVPLPPGVQAVWELAKAYREATPTRENICLNGLWKWQPAPEQTTEVPASDWGYFKVPGSWPGITDYMQKDSQTVFAHPAWKDQKLAGIRAAWYEREITVPAAWAGRRIALQADYLNSLAAVYVDGKKTGEMRFPGGELDLTAICRPGNKHTLSVLVIAMPLKGVMLSYTDSASAREVKGSVARRGFCGDVFLVSTPNGPRLADVRVETSVRQKTITFDAALEGALPSEGVRLHARVLKNGRSIKEFRSTLFTGAALKERRLRFSEKWRPDDLWDIHTPQNTYDLELSMHSNSETLIDTALPVRFGFREFWIEGRDFFLNGSRIFLSTVPLDNAQVSAALANYEGARESLARLKSFGINFVYTHNYDCLPGSHLSFSELLRAADDAGMLVALTQPHLSHYDWKATDADAANGYLNHATFYVRAAQSHPSVVAYSMSHNATGYNEDMNPDMIDGLGDPRDTWSARNAAVALRAEAIVRSLDPSRIVYHHASGNLSSMHQSNFYPNFVPIQELSDWFEHWATVGVKPAFLCEYGAPFTWDWTMYRGWYKGKREFGSAVVPWEFCIAEWNSQFLGDRAFQISEPEKANLRWEAKQLREGKLWHRWDYPSDVGSTRFEERYPVFAAYLTDNWRSFRTWGVSAISPWEHGHFWKLRPGVDKRRQELKVDWQNLQQPGLSPDYIEQRYERVDLAFERSDWIATPAAKALLRNNLPLLGWIAGKPASFTSKDHLFVPGETVEKQLIVINNSRETVDCECEWALDLPQPVTGRKTVRVPTGDQTRVPLRFELPESLPAGRYALQANFRFKGAPPDAAALGHEQSQHDEFAMTIVPKRAPPRETLSAARIGLFDPAGETRAMLQHIGVRCQTIKPGADLSPFDLVIIGKTALSASAPGLDLARVREGLKVIVFEQTAEALERRLGFRIAEYGLRQVFPRVADHPALAGLNTAEHLRDWRGEATTIPPRLKYELNPKFNGAPSVTWCGLPVTRLWRCGNRGNVASVLIEKPTRGDFLPLLDGGYSLQYSPLMEYREGNGMMLFCQVDVTGRTEMDPVAATLVFNLLDYVSSWKPAPRPNAIYLGDPAGMVHLKSIGIVATEFQGNQRPSPNEVLILGPGAARAAGNHAAAVKDWLGAGGRVLALSLTQVDAETLLPFTVTIKPSEHIASFFEIVDSDSPFCGIGPADVYNRDPRELPLVVGGADVIGNGALARAQGASVVFCQLAPWEFEKPTQPNLRRTHRRASFLCSRLLANMGVAGLTPLLERFNRAIDAARPEQRWLEGFYLDQPEEWDDPYRFFRW